VWFNEPAEGWGWITGEPFFYTNWAPGEPNDAGDENHIHFHPHHPGQWNDLNWGPQDPDWHQGYVVEFECNPKGPVVQQVSGSGHFYDPRINEETGLEGGWRNFSFTARKYADGRVRGEYQLKNRNTEFKAHGSVTCFEVVDNQVWLGGFEEQGDGADAPNSVYWTVVDNGQGSEAPPDQISLRGRSTAMSMGSAYCTYKWDRVLYDVESGNIQIK
jgi:hypothetical protein